jgi:GT2 family glycosyltransferase
MWLIVTGFGFGDRLASKVPSIGHSLCFQGEGILTAEATRDPALPDREPLVTIVVVPRERFGVTRRALEALYANTSEPFRLVYVDGGSPRRIRRYLAEQARARGFTLVRVDRYLVPNEARNLGLSHVQTPYVVFIDNDAVPSPGWLGKLIECAETTGASIVGPMYFIGEPEREEIHMAAGDAHFEEWKGRRRFVERHRFAGKRPADVRDHLVRMPCEQVEFHCMLVRREIFDRLGPLDEGLLSLCEHSDLCLLVRKHGGEVYFEPDAVVTYITTGRFGWSDYSFFFRRWSDAWNEGSLERFREKWELPADDRGMVSLERFASSHRQVHFESTLRALERVCGWRWGSWLGRNVLLGLERRINRLLVGPVASSSRSATPPGAVRAGR